MALEVVESLALLHLGGSAEIWKGKPETSAVRDAPIQGEAATLVGRLLRTFQQADRALHAAARLGLASR
jgi:hypothetical protein